MVATLLVEVYITSVSRDFGEIGTLGAHMFYQLFYHMEECLLLDPSNEIHIFALHFVFLPRVNRHLRIFSSGHNNGPISTERNMIPVQLWVNGLMQIQRSTHRVAQELCERVSDIKPLSILTEQNTRKYIVNIIDIRCELFSIPYFHYYLYCFHFSL